MVRFQTFTIASIFILFSLVFFAACSQQATEQKEEPTTTESETTPPDDEKASRPSPPKVFEDSIQEAYIRIDYSSPGVKGRQVWGELVKYGEIWRTGANEATTMLVDKPVLVEGQPLPAGRYSIFTFPEPDQWTIIFNAEPDQWGAFEYDQAQDVLRIKVKPQQVSELRERFAFENMGEGVVAIAWEYLRVPFKVESQK